MAVTWRASVNSKGVIHTSPTERLLRVRSSVEIYDGGDPGTVLKAHGFETKYELYLFDAMTAIQIRDAIVENGIGGVPSIRSICIGITQDWIDSAVIRSISLPYAFGP